MNERKVTITLRPHTNGWHVTVMGETDGEQEADIDLWTGKRGDLPSGPANDGLDIARLYLCRPWRNE